MEALAWGGGGGVILKTIFACEKIPPPRHPLALSLVWKIVQYGEYRYRLLGLTTHFSKIIKLQFGNKLHTLLRILQLVSTNPAKDQRVRSMISIPGFLSFAKLMMMSSAPATTL